MITKGKLLRILAQFKCIKISEDVCVERVSDGWCVYYRGVEWHMYHHPQGKTVAFETLKGALALATLIK